MNRRGFLGLLGKIISVGAAIGIAPELLAPVEKKLSRWIVVDADGLGDFVTIQAAINALPKDGGTVFVRAGIYDP